MKAAQIDQLAERLWHTPWPADTFSSPRTIGRYIGNLHMAGDALAIAALRGAPAEELQRLALEWIARRGVQVPA